MIPTNQRESHVYLPIQAGILHKHHILLGFRSTSKWIIGWTSATVTASRHSTYYYWPWYVDATLVLRKCCNASSSQKSAQICSRFICLSFSIILRFILLLIVYRACIFTRVWGLIVLLLLKTCIIPLIKVSKQNLNNPVHQFYMNQSCINTQKRKTKKIPANLYFHAAT